MKSKTILRFGLIFIPAIVYLLSSAISTAQYAPTTLTGTTERVSISSSEEQGNSDSVSPSISSGGLYVAFESLASNLVARDTNGAYDVFVHDRRKGVMERISVSSSGEQGNFESGGIPLSPRMGAMWHMTHLLTPW